MMDLRYHLISLTAIFLALAVGIVVGSSLGSSERQTALVQSLQQRFDRVMEEDQRTRAQNDLLRRRLGAREQALRELMPHLIQGRIPTGTRLAVFVCGDALRREALDAVRQSLSLAGAEVTSTTRLPGTLGPIPAALRPAAATDGAVVTPGEEARAAARAVTRAVLSGDTGGQLAELTRATGATLEGSYTFPVRRIVVIAAPTPEGSAEPPGVAAERLAEAVLTTAQEFGVRVVAATPEESDGSGFLRTAAQQGLTTVHHIDTAPGQIALVLALAGTRGPFGSRQGAAP